MYIIADDVLQARTSVCEGPGQEGGRTGGEERVKGEAVLWGKRKTERKDRLGGGQELMVHPHVQRVCRVCGVCRV